MKVEARECPWGSFHGAVYLGVEEGACVHEASAHEGQKREQDAWSCEPMM